MYSAREAVYKKGYDVGYTEGFTKGNQQNTYLSQECDEPVRRGRWIKTEQENACAMWTDFKCPVCDTIFDGNDWKFDEWKGCPVCLTRLDGGN